MNIFDPEHLAKMILMAPPILLSLTLHEYAHARVAFMFGDPTAYKAGRVTLNPLRHLDPLGTIMLFFSGFIGWAKPVPVNPFLLKPQNLGNIMVSLAGPLTNLALALVAGCLCKIVEEIAGTDPSTGLLCLVGDMLWITMALNIGLAIFNMLPVFPLDGHHILGSLLPVRMRDGYARFQRSTGFFIFLIIIAGPKLLGIMSGKDVPNPLGFVYDHAIDFFTWAIGIS